MNTPTKYNNKKNNIKYTSSYSILTKCKPANTAHAGDQCLKMDLNDIVEDGL